MKYLIGLIMFFGIGVTSFAQDTTNTDDMKTNASEPLSAATPNNSGAQCLLNDELTSREGQFNVNQGDKYNDLKIKREKDGDGVIKYDNDVEYYEYKENKKGENKFVYDVDKGDESLKVIKNKDGSGEVMYYKYYDKIDAPKIFDEGIKVEGLKPAESICR